MSINKEKIVLHQKEDGTLQLRDEISGLWCACGKPAEHATDDHPPHDFQCTPCYIEGGGGATRSVSNAPVIKTYPAMNEKIVELLRLGRTPDGLYAAQRIEELEQTAVVRGMIGLYDNSLIASSQLYEYLENYGKRVSPMPEWLSKVAEIWTVWHDDPDPVWNCDRYIDRIRAVIGAPCTSTSA